MTEAERKQILEKSKIFFRERVAKKHKENTEKLTSLILIHLRISILLILHLETHHQLIWQRH